ncbi:TPA: hypothetical protein N0F65_012253 [Lagenidium giganteum]|uniref:PDZ domain-containing protein n=1 Tax=Lagenidium giganteum TaxID=4803 RepID=A0AAV2ZNA3_9STRA|nr:TPA: hypothetical protein N0F65_012253 [Lagenidium giganteum]
MNRTFEREEFAAIKIQNFIRTRLARWKRRSKPTQQELQNTGSTDMSMGPAYFSDELHYQYEVLLVHGYQLGVDFFECQNTGYPCVEAAEGNEALPGMWHMRAGDYLIAINEYSAHLSSMPFHVAMDILDSGVRPAVLRFRRPNERDLRRHSSRFSSRLLSLRQTRQKLREKLERSLCYVVWREEEGPLGLGFVQDEVIPYPAIGLIKEEGVVAQPHIRSRLSMGDLLLSINNFDVSSLTYEQVIQTLKYAPKPLVLTFRRTRRQMHSERWCEL